MPTDLLTRRPAGGFRLAIWWTAAAGGGLIALAVASLAVAPVGAARVLAAGAGLVAVAGLAAGGRALPACSRRRARTAILAGTALPLVLAGGAQLAVPPVMEGRMRNGLAAMGEVYSVDIGSFPAVKMLWGGVDRAEVHLGELDLSRRREGGGPLGGDVLGQMQGMRSLEVTATGLKAGSISAEDVKVTKEGEQVRGRATVTPSDVTDALGGGPGIEVTPKVVDGELRLTMSGDPLGGRKLSVRLFAQDGQIMSELQIDEETAEAMGLPPGQRPPAQPMFSNDQLIVDSLKVREAGGRLVIHAGARIAGDEPVA
jgi:hypothetical protein